MGAQMTSTVVITRPVSEVFQYILDFDKNLPEWATDVESVEKTSQGPVGPGTTFDLVQTIAGRSRRSSLKLVEVDPNNSIKAEAEVGPLSLRLNFGVAQVEEGTQVTVDGDGELRGVLKLISPIATRQGGRIWDSRLSSLRSVLEA
jgi:hypothetical protein